MSKILQLLGAVWCKVMHRQISRPVRGRYICFQCLRSFEVSWHKRPGNSPVATLSVRPAGEPERQARLKRAVGLSLVLFALPARATLVIGIPVKQGVVICADRRASRGQKKSDTRHKIRRLSKWAASGNTGQPRYYNRVTHAVAFDANGQAANYFSDKSFESPDWNQYIQTTRQAFLADVLARPDVEHPDPDPDGFIFQTIVFSLTNEKVLQVVWNRFFTFYATSAPIDPSRAYPMWFGHGTVFDEIDAGHRPQFDDVRADPEIRHLLVTRPMASEVDQEEALHVARKLIRITAERLKWLEQDDDVSPTCDCAVIDRASGFRWDTDVPSRPAVTQKKSGAKK